MSSVQPPCAYNTGVKAKPYLGPDIEETELNRIQYLLLHPWSTALSSEQPSMEAETWTASSSMALSRKAKPWCLPLYSAKEAFSLLCTFLDWAFKLQTEDDSSHGQKSKSPLTFFLITVHMWKSAGEQSTNASLTVNHSKQYQSSLFKIKGITFQSSGMKQKYSS